MTAVIPAGVATARDLVQPALVAALERLTPQIRRVAAYHLGLEDAEGRPCRAGGKALRPALALLSVRAAGRPAERGIAPAVAVELVHNFSLLHDDIMDGDTERRHRPTAWTVFGSPAAILAGDALLALAQEVLLEDGAPQGRWAARCLLAAVQRLIAGQEADIAFERRPEVSMEECLAMAGDKTAALMACASSIGAIFAGAPPELAMSLADYGSHLGLAFQLTDDLLGIWGAPEVTGKPVWSDLRSRKKTLPVAAALRGGDGSPHGSGYGAGHGAGHGAARQLGELLGREEPLGEDDLEFAAALVEKAGGRAWAEAETARQLETALACLDCGGVPGPVRGELTAIARFITERTY